MATALEQILSSASQRIENPIESSMDGISFGMKLAEQQYNNKIKQQEIELKKQDAQANFLSKGISALSALSKVKNAAQRKLLTGVTLNYLRQGGLEDPNGNIQAFLSDPEAVKTVAESVEKSGEKNKEILAIARLYDFANADPEVALPEIAKLKGNMLTAQAKGFEQTVLEKLRQQGRMESVAEKEFGENISKYSISQSVAEMLQKYNGNPAIQNGLLRGYISTVGGPAAFVRNNLKEIQNPTPKQQEAIQRILGSLTEAENEYGNPEQRGSAISKAASARAEFGSILASSAQVAPRAAKSGAQKALNLTQLRKEATSLTKEDVGVITAADKIIRFSDRPGATAAGILIGQMQQLRENKASVLRADEYRIALENQKFFERLDLFLNKYSPKSKEQIEVLGPQIRKEYKEIAQSLKQGILEGLGNRVQPIVNEARAMGASDDQIKQRIFDPRLHQYIFRPVYPTPSGEPEVPQLPESAQAQPSKSAAPVSAPSSQKTKVAPKESLVEKAKKQFPNDWKKRLDKLGYDTGGL